MHYVEDLKEAEEDIGRAYRTAVESDYKEPGTYKAMKKLEKEERSKWEEAVEKEKQDFLKREVLRAIRIEDVPPGRKLLGTKWVFKKKRDGRYRARLVALGYTQVPGQDFTDNFSPVVDDTVLRILLTAWMIWGCSIDQMDVETAFLEGELEEHERVYIKCPEGFDLPEGYCYEVRKGMYGLVQAARLFWQRFSKCLTKELGFKACRADQCVFVKDGKDGKLIVMLYVDDSALIGSRRDIDDFLKEISKHFTIKTEGKLNDFLGCEIIKDEKEKQCWLLQPHLVDKLQRTFGDIKEVKGMPATPGTPRKVIIRAEEGDNDVLDPAKHKIYRSGVGSLLYLLKHSRPELSNVIRELSKAMLRPTQDHMEEMLRVIKWVINTPNLGLKMKPEVTRDRNGKIIWKLKGISDATWGSDLGDRKSITGYVLFFMGVPIAWKSKKQMCVALSSTEAEYVAMSELVKEILYVKQLLEELDIEIELPVRVYVDNIGAIHLARNNVGHAGTKHMDIKHHFIRELQGWMLETCFVDTTHNTADIFTKNPTRIEHERHSTKLVETVPEDKKLSS